VGIGLVSIGAIGLEGISSSDTFIETFPPINTVSPVISGSPYIGGELSCTTGTWTGTTPITYAYQWQRDGVNIGLNENTYILVLADAGAVITCIVLASNIDGTVPDVSNGITVTVAAPANTVAPVVTGTPRSGQTLSASLGTWTGDPTIIYGYQWKRQ
jgi:hypothetical protein